ncbi:hypothetical protein E1262_22070 [Jiangella aurantiaca]|uniref:Uncharacterized protein n=1 Tax=Jiangella aurantiaca TaxID=2530373 RepID=A0A4R5A9R9_9ACTN|nr:hypothetical protein [Jiangella aurantiaca]TDD66442.1 hypothetical protein E1262_22070 [Jiangella aurantiaca]
MLRNASTGRDKPVMRRVKTRMSAFERHSVRRECLLGRHARRISSFLLAPLLSLPRLTVKNTGPSGQELGPAVRQPKIFTEGVTIMDALSGILDSIVALVNQLLGTVTGLLG